MVPGSNNLAIGVSLIMRDGFTTQANIARNAMNNLHGGADRLARQQAVLARNVNAAGAAIGIGLIGGMAGMYKQGADFGYIMKYVSINADATGKSFDKLSNKALEVGKRTMFSSMEVAEGMKFMAQAGLNTDQITSSIDAAANLAQATMTGLPESADLINRMASAFEIQKTEKNMFKISDILGLAANKSETDIADLGEAMKYSQATAHRLGMTLEETAAAMMVMSSTGARGSMGGTAFENMVRELATAAEGTSKKKNKALGMLGMTTADIKDANGNLKPFASILERIGKGLQGMGTVDKQNAIKNLLNVRGARATPLADQLGKYTSYIESLNNSGGFTGKMGGEMMDTDKGKIDILMSNWEALRIQLGGIFATVFTPIVKVLTKITDVLSSMVKTPVGKFLATIATGFILIKTVSFAYRAILLGIRVLHYDMGISAASSGARTVSWYSRMTAAARTYSGAAAGAMGMGGLGAMGMGGMRPGSVMKNSAGRWVQVMPGGMHSYLPKGSSKIRMAKFGNFMGRYGGAMALGGMGLSMAGDSMGQDSSVGKGMGIVGDTLGFAGTGAMLGSIIPGVGTTVGAIIGGVGGLMYSLYNRLNDVNDEINSQKEKLARPEFNVERWRKQADLYQSMNWKDRAIMEMGTNNSGSVIRHRDGRNVQHEGRTTSTTVILQVDGVDKFTKTTQDQYLKEAIELGI